MSQGENIANKTGRMKRNGKNMAIFQENQQSANTFTALSSGQPHHQYSISLQKLEAIQQCQGKSRIWSKFNQ
jgi:hypothetical protein